MAVYVSVNTNKTSLTWPIVAEGTSGYAANHLTPPIGLTLKVFRYRKVLQDLIAPSPNSQKYSNVGTKPNAKCTE